MSGTRGEALNSKNTLGAIYEQSSCETRKRAETCSPRTRAAVLSARVFPLCSGNSTTLPRGSQHKSVSRTQRRPTGSHTSPLIHEWPA